jgi:hypothetical protein
MKNWEYNLEGYNPDDIELNGNRFMLGNGYMGLRGTLEEQGKEELAGILLNGVYDQVPGKWRECPLHHRGRRRRNPFPPSATRPPPWPDVKGNGICAQHRHGGTLCVHG